MFLYFVESKTLRNFFQQVILRIIFAFHFSFYQYFSPEFVISSKASNFLVSLGFSFGLDVLLLSCDFSLALNVFSRVENFFASWEFFSEVRIFSWDGNFFKRWEFFVNLRIFSRNKNFLQSLAYFPRAES